MDVSVPPARIAGSKRRTIWRCVIGIVLILAVVVIFVLAYAACLIERDNFHVVVPGQIYRSGQMDAEDLTSYIQKYQIKSILNLRGENLNQSWHETEMAIAAKLNVVHYDRGLNSGTQLTLQEMDDLVATLRQAPKPALVHCWGGADRSGLACALYCFAVQGEKPEEACNQMSIWYGHIPLIRPKVIAMDNSFWRYVTNAITEDPSHATAPAIKGSK